MAKSECLYKTSILFTVFYWEQKEINYKMKNKTPEKSIKVKELADTAECLRM
jgi:hypothetical protein